MGKFFETKSNGLLARAQARKTAFDERHIEKRVVACRCTATEKRFSAVFTRNQGESFFTLRDTVVDDHSSSPGDAGEVSEVIHDVRELALAQLHCPHCGFDEVFINCDRCVAMVCGSRSETLSDGNLYFRCAPSCGREARTSPMKTIKVADPKAQKMLTAQPPLLRLPKAK